MNFLYIKKIIILFDISNIKNFNNIINIIFNIKNDIFNLFLN